MTTATKPGIALTPVESSQIHAIGFDPASSALHMQFKGKDGPGPVYTYAGVNADLHKELIGAKSIGSFFGQKIKSAKDKDGKLLYPFTKLPLEKK